MQYIVSSHHDYEGYICDDAGPAFAADYGWNVRVLGRTALDTSQPQVIDPLLSREEQDLMLAEIRQQDCLYLLRVTDPLWTPFDYAVARLAVEAIKLPNVVLMFTYTPNEQTAYLLSVARNRTFVHAPYVYRSEQERPIDAARKRRILLSGRTVADIYPLRHAFARYARLWPPLALRSDVLPHPGYHRDARELRHTRDGYISKLAEYAFAFVCSGRTRSEFLKYREIAYAGCAPVGDLPASLLACPSTSFVRYVGGVRSISRSLSNFGTTWTEIATGYRAFMRDQRNAEGMIRYVDEQVRAI